MALVLNDDEKLLAESAEGFLNEKAPVEGLRKLRDERSEDGIDRALWSEMSEMGFAGVLIPKTTAVWIWATWRQDLSPLKWGKI